MSHVNKVIDADPHFVIDINTRNIKNVSQTKTSLVQYDHNSERFSFTLPRFIEGHDMMECNSVQVHYFSSANPDTKGVYAVTDLAICEEDTENVCCTWLISQNVTQTAGALQFMLRFACLAADGSIEYAWHTNPFRGISITAGMNNAEAVVEQYADILEQWKVALFSLTEEGIRNINTATLAAIEDIEKAGERVANSLPDDYAEMTEKVKNVTNALKGTASGAAIGLHDISPLEHTLEVTVKSKNILSAVIYKDASPHDIAVSCDMKIEKEKLYTISFDTLNTGTTLWIALSTDYRVPVSGQTVSKQCDGTKQTFVFQAKDDFTLSNISLIQVNTASPVGVTKGDIYNLMIEEGTVATPYTPYVADITNVGVKKCGKNIIPYPFAETTKVHSGITFTDNGDGSITANGTATANAIFYFYANETEGLQDGVYALSGGNSTCEVYCRAYNTSIQIGIKSDSGGGSIATVSGQFDKGVRVYCRIPSDTKVENLVIRPQLELNSVCTEYEPYNIQGLYFAYADGTVDGLYSAYPSTTLISDTEGVVVDCEYNRDINKAFEELTQAIISLGGNV